MNHLWHLQFPKKSIHIGIYLLKLNLQYRTRLSSTTTSSSSSSLDSSIATPISHTFDLSRVSELITNQHWSDLKTLTNQTTSGTFLHVLFQSELDSDLVLRYFKWSEEEFRVSHHLELYCRLFHLLANSKKYGKIRSLLHHFVKKDETHSNSSIFHSLAVTGGGFCANSIIVDMLILAYVYDSKTDLAFEAFLRAGDYGFKLSITSCNPMLGILVKERKFAVVEIVYKEMIRRRIELDVITFNIVIKGFCKAGKLKKAGDVVEDMKVRGFSPSVVTYNTLMNGYCKNGGAGKMYKADGILKEMVSNGIHPIESTFNILIDGFCKDENLSAAMKVFKEMQGQGLKPGVVTYNSLINGHCNEGKLDDALCLRDEMVGSGLKLNIVTYNALINGFSKKKMLKEARELFDGIGKKGLDADVVTFNTLIDAYCKAGKIEEAIALRDLMMDKPVFPDVATYNCLIGGFLREGKMEEASKLAFSQQR